jgi:4-amino-4-deoxy-L-arabinose transferase-like glycosyltransferase
VRRWIQEVTRVGARENAADPWFLYFSIFGYVFPWIIFFIVGGIVLLQQVIRRERNEETLALFLLIVPLFVMSLFRDRQDRYMLPMIAPAAIIAARGVVEHFRSWSRWNRADTIVTAMHWGILIVMAVGLPIAGATTKLKRADGLPWFPWNFAIPAAITVFALIVVAIYAHRVWRGSIVLATFVVMLMLQAMFVFGFASSASARSEMRPLAESIAQLYPDAEVFNAHPEGKRPPTDLGVYLNRVIRWVAEPSAIPPSNHAQILLYRQNAGDPAPKPPPGWDVFDVKPRDKDYWYAFIREPKS